MEAFKDSTNGMDQKSASSLPLAIEGLRAKLQILEINLEESYDELYGIEASVRYKDYERLRRKCDMLESEREVLINETFALLDTSAAANAAEVAANESKLRRNAVDQLAEATQRLTRYFSDQIEKLALIRQWQLEESIFPSSKSKHD